MERMVLSDLQLRTVISCTRQSNGYMYTRQSTIAAPESPIYVHFVEHRNLPYIGQTGNR